MPEPPPTPRSWLVRAATSAGPVKTLAGAIAAIIGLVAVVLPLLGGGGTDRAAAEIAGRRTSTQPFSREDFERLPRGDRAAEPRGA